MRKVKNYVCPECGRVFKSLGGWSGHMEKMHPETIPEGFTLAQYFYYLQTGRTSGKCVICGKPTSWNESSMKYNRMCDDPQCKVNYRKKFEAACIKKNGYVHKLDDPEVQRYMLSRRRIAGSYTFTNDNSEGANPINYVGKDELAFLQMLDMLEWPASDIMAPSPHTYEYEYKNPKDKENEGTKFYIPDFYIVSLNLEVEVKDTSNNHQKIRDIDNVKDACKRKTMEANKAMNYVFIDRKNFEPFFSFLFEAKATILDKEIQDSSVGKKIRLVEDIVTESDTYDEPDFSPALETSQDMDVNRSEEVRGTRAPIRYEHRKRKPFRSNPNDILTLYHGSEKDYPYLRSLGMDFGNALEKPGWSLFVARDKAFTFRWALFRAIRMARKENNRLEANILWNPELKTYNITDVTFDVMKDLFEDGSIKAYVYTIKVPRYMVGLGNDSQHDERTIRSESEIHYESKEMITVTEEIARKYGNVVDNRTFYAEERKYRRKPKVFNRGLQSILMTKDYSYQNKENKAALNAIFAALNDGTLSPGDDIEEFLKSKGLRIKSIGLFKRLLIAAGIEGIEPGELEYDPMIALEANELDELLPEHDDEMYVLVMESNTISGINTPKELSEWMKRNIKYKEFDKLMSYDDVLSTGKGSCHDQALFEKKMFDKHLDLKTGLLFFVEYNDTETAGGMTHTLLYYIENGKYYWFENAWGGEDGIHGPYGSIKELKNDVTTKHSKMQSSKRYPNLEWGTVPVSKLKPGISLGEYVDICLG